jgi:hypothetical protein
MGAQIVRVFVVTIYCKETKKTETVSVYHHVTKNWNMKTLEVTKMSIILHYHYM